MTKDDIMRMAREAGFTPHREEWLFTEMLEAFANLVAAHKAEVITAEAYRCGYEAGVVAECETRLLFTETELKTFVDLAAAAEREACAKLCEERGMVKGGEVFASRIRSRGTT